jgi:hypothetical protein
VVGALGDPAAASEAALRTSASLGPESCGALVLRLDGVRRRFGGRPSARVWFGGSNDDDGGGGGGGGDRASVHNTGFGRGADQGPEDVTLDDGDGDDGGAKSR